MADLEAYKDKFSESGQRIFQNALNESRRRDQNYISVEHIVSALSKEEPDLFNSTMRGSTSAKVFALLPIQPIFLSVRWSVPARMGASQSKRLTFSMCFRTTT